jgi:hypothetical protein
MKRALLIAGGTLGGLGAVLAITPPQFIATQNVGSLAGGLPLGASSAPTQSAPVATKPAATKPAATKAAKPTKSTKARKQPTAAATVAPTDAATSAPAPAPNGYSGSVTGASFNARNYGTLSATVTFKNGSITSVSASQSPRSWSQNSLSALIPYVDGGKVTLEQIKQYSASQLPCGTGNSCRSQASFTADAFWNSVKSAISKAGL